MKLSLFSRLTVASWCVACLAAIVANPAPALAQFEELSPKIPTGANALVLVNMKKVLESPVAVERNWKQKHSEAQAFGLMLLSPDSDAVILATHLDLEMMIPLWSVALVDLDHAPSLTMVQHLSGGMADKIGNLNAVHLGSDAFLVQFQPELMGVMAPANRQAVARWVREAVAAKEPNLSPYLKEAYAYAENLGTPIIMAIDLEDVATPAGVRTALSANEELAKAENLDELSQFLASIRGVTLGITLQGAQPFGKVKVDFERDAAIDPELAKTILIHALDRRGAMLDELEEWTPKVAGKSVTLEGHLTASGMRRLSSLFDRPPSFDRTAEVPENPTAAPEEPSESDMLGKSQVYLRQITHLLDDLQRQPSRNPNRTIGSFAIWYDTFARRIDQLPAVGVDPDLLQFGAFASQSLRSAASDIRQSAASRRIAEVNVPMKYDYFTYNTTFGFTFRDNLFGAGYVPWGYSGTQAVPDTAAFQRERTRVRTEARIQGFQSAQTTLSQLDQALGDIRRKMTERYKAPF